MRPIERAALLLFASATALASSAAVLMLDHHGIITIPRMSVDQIAERVAPPKPPSLLSKLQARLPGAVATEPYVPAEPPPLRLEPAPEVALETPAEAEAQALAETPADEPHGETSSWSSEVTTKAAPSADGTKLAALPPQTGWQNPDVLARKPASLEERLAEISPGANRRITAKFDAAKVAWPPVELGLVAIKDEKVLELHARSITGEWQFVHRYPVLAASGTSGPKLTQGDKQVPEGVYGISFLNPNSKYHVSLRVDYPNAFDKEMASKDGRKKLGGDIMIHGKQASVGCLAIGDEAAEEVFVLAASIGLPKMRLVIAPTDFRKYGLPPEDEKQPKWLPKLYTKVSTAMTDFKAPPSNSLLSLIGL